VGFWRHPVMGESVRRVLLAGQRREMRLEATKRRRSVLFVSMKEVGYQLRQCARVGGDSTKQLDLAGAAERRGRVRVSAGRGLIGDGVEEDVQQHGVEVGVASVAHHLHRLLDWNRGAIDPVVG
jgi:hypothetical protein